MGNVNSTRSSVISENFNVTLYKDHSKQLLQNENSLNDTNLQSTTLNTYSSTSTLNEYNCHPMNRLNSVSSFSSSVLESPGWDSSTSTLDNVHFKASLSPSFNYKNNKYNEYGNLDYNPAIGQFTNTLLVDEPDDISDTTLNTPRSSIVFPREHDNNSDETATINPLLVFNSDEFYSLSEVHVISLLQRDDIEVSEIEIWNHLILWGIKNTSQLSSKRSIKWSKRDFESLEGTLKNCIPWIRFFQINPDEFAKYVWPFRQILPRLTIGNFLREHITGHAPIMETNITPPRIPSSDIDSTTMTGRHATILASWTQQETFCGKISLNFNLLYRMSKDGFSSKMFHEKCDDKGPTILVIKLLNSNHIIGAYNPLSYQKSKILRRRSIYSKRNSAEFIDNSNIKEIRMRTFLFSFQTRYYPEETALISRIIPEYSSDATKYSQSGLCFGLGPDLRVSLDKEKIGSVLPASFQSPILDFAGRFKFEEIEVFQVLKREDAKKDEWSF